MYAVFTVCRTWAAGSQVKQDVALWRRAGGTSTTPSCAPTRECIVALRCTAFRPGLRSSYTEWDSTLFSQHALFMSNTCWAWTSRSCVNNTVFYFRNLHKDLFLICCILTILNQHYSYIETFICLPKPMPRTLCITLLALVYSVQTCLYPAHLRRLLCFSPVA